MRATAGMLMPRRDLAKSLDFNLGYQKRFQTIRQWNGMGTYQLTGIH